MLVIPNTYFKIIFFSEEYVMLANFNCSFFFFFFDKVVVIVFLMFIFIIDWLRALR